MTAFTNPTNDELIYSFATKDGDTLTTKSGAKWVWQGSQWCAVTFAPSSPIQNVTATSSAQGVEVFAGGQKLVIPGIGVVAEDAVDLPDSADIFIYGATPQGLLAAVGAALVGTRSIVVEPYSVIGGMMSSGIAKTDQRANASPRATTNPAMGEILRDAARMVGQDSFDASWDDQWNYPCQVWQAVWEELVKQKAITVFTGWRLKESGGVTVNDAEIIKVVLEKVADPSITATVRADQLISAWTMPDLSRFAGVALTAGREPTATYSEDKAGTTAANLTFTGVDPYVVPGDAGSGLLPGITNSPLPAVGSAATGGMWDCLRLVATNDPANRIPFPLPKNYEQNKGSVELLKRWIKQGGGPQTLSALFTRYDIREDAYLPGLGAGYLIENWNNTNISLNMIGGSPNYWNMTYAQRAAEDEKIREHTACLIYMCLNDPEIPAAIRTELAQWGLLKGEAYDSSGWPPIVYRREPARMTSAQYVMTQANLAGTAVAPDPIAYGSYNCDIHFCGAWLDSGVVKIEGLVSYSPPNRYPIDRGVVLPPRTVVRNLQEVTAIGSSHIAWGSLRVDVTLGSIGFAAGIAAGLAIRRNDDVGAITGADIQEVMGLIAPTTNVGLLAITGTANQTGVTQTQTYGSIAIVGQWDYEASPVGWWGGSSGNFHDRGSGKGTKTITWTPDVAACGGPGLYEIYVNFPAKHGADMNDAESAPLTIKTAGVTKAKTLNLLRGDYIMRRIGVFYLSGVAGEDSVMLSNTGTTGRLRANGVWFRKISA